MTDFVTDRWYLAGRVKRYATWPTLHTQTVGEHSWQVACIYEHLFGELSSAVERYIRLHDVPELVVGDPPFPLKSKNPELKGIYDRLEVPAYYNMGLKPPELEDKERYRVKVCDLAEMMLFGLVEVQMGNRLAMAVVERTQDAALKLAQTHLSGDEHRACVMLFHREMERHRLIINEELTG